MIVTISVYIHLSIDTGSINHLKIIELYVRSCKISINWRHMYIFKLIPIATGTGYMVFREFCTDNICMFLRRPYKSRNLATEGKEKST